MALLLVPAPRLLEDLDGSSNINTHLWPPREFCKKWASSHAPSKRWRMPALAGPRFALTLAALPALALGFSSVARAASAFLSVLSRLASSSSRIATAARGESEARRAAHLTLPAARQSAARNRQCDTEDGGRSTDTLDANNLKF